MASFSVQRYAIEHAPVWDHLVQHSRTRHFLFRRDYMEYHADRFADASLLIRDGEFIVAAIPASRHGNSIVSHGGLTFGGLISPPELTTRRTVLALEAALQAWVELPKVHDPRGNLTFLEARRHVPFDIRRAYWIYDVPGGEVRGGHAYRTLEEFFVALSGSFDVVLDDTEHVTRATLNRSYYGLYVPRMIWRHIENFSTNAVCLIVASLPYDARDYVRDHEAYHELQARATA